MSKNLGVTYSRSHPGTSLGLGSMRLSRRILKNYGVQEMLMILAHECIHSYLLEIKKSDDHGLNFQEWARLVSRRSAQYVPVQTYAPLPFFENVDDFRNTFEWKCLKCKEILLKYRDEKPKAFWLAYGSVCVDKNRGHKWKLISSQKVASLKASDHLGNVVVVVDSVPV